MAARHDCDEAASGRPQPRSVLRPMNRRVAAVLLAATIATGCQPDGGTTSASSGQAPSAEACDWLTAPGPPDADEPPCDIEFREVVRLDDVDSVTPRPPIMVLRDGRYITATYSLGKVALWSPDGTLSDVVGRGPGEGPGEFNYAGGFAQVDDNELFVLTLRPVVHRYTTGGRFVRSFRLQGFGGAAAAVTYRGFAISTGHTLAGTQGILISADSAGAFAGLRGRRGTMLVVAAAEDIGIWSAEHDRYVLRRHAFPGGSVVDSLVVTRDWFPGPRGNEGVIYRLHADGRGLIWTVASVADPDAPSNDWMTSEHELIDMEEDRANAVLFRDDVIEALAPDGRLVAAARFDSYGESAEPMLGNIWYRQTEDMLSIIVLEVRLTQR